MITLDGSAGEGGGQILRTALSLSAVTGRAVHIENVRGGRARPGLLRQHLTALRAVAEITGGRIEGGELGSPAVTLRPGPIRGGRFEFAVGSAGSALLVLQTVLPVLLHADVPSIVELAGGTHNPSAPPFDFLELAFLPAIRRMGFDAKVQLHRHGFMPAGGGRVTLFVTPIGSGSALVPFECMARGEERARTLHCLHTHLPRNIAQRELDTAGEALGVPAEQRSEHTPVSDGPGNMLRACVQFDELTACFVGFGERGVTAERVATRLAREVRRYLRRGAAITHHLADQLLLPMALARGGRFTTERPSLHALTNAEVIARFLEVDISFEEVGEHHVCAVRRR